MLVRRPNRPVECLLGHPAQATPVGGIATQASHVAARPWPVMRIDGRQGPIGTKLAVEELSQKAPRPQHAVLEPAIDQRGFATTKAQESPTGMVLNGSCTRVVATRSQHRFFACELGGVCKAQVGVIEPRRRRRGGLMKRRVTPPGEKGRDRW